MTITHLFPGCVKFITAPASTELSQLQAISEKFNLPYLGRLCDNISSDDAELNPSIATYTSDELGQMLKKLFLNKPLYTDVTFSFKGE